MLPPDLGLSIEDAESAQHGGRSASPSFAVRPTRKDANKARYKDYKDKTGSGHRSRSSRVMFLTKNTNFSRT